LRQLTEQHGDKLLPAGEPLGSILGFKLAHVAREIWTLKKGQDLAK
jgi:hypothetical protein